MDNINHFIEGIKEGAWDTARLNRLLTGVHFTFLDEAAKQKRKAYLYAIYLLLVIKW